MNIDDVVLEKIANPEQVWDDIFMSQWELARKYEEIERRNGHWFPNMADPPSLEDGHFQKHLKDLFWRTTEELAEAVEVVDSIPFDWRNKFDTDTKVRHFFEELADSMHFFVEASILVGITPTDVNHIAARVEFGAPSDCARGKNGEYLVKAPIANFIFDLGIAANALKNKPWKSTQMPTDVARFLGLMLNSWHSMLKFWASFDCTIIDIWSLYTRKKQVNQFRQRTNY